MADREKYIEVLNKTVKTVNEDAPIKISLECIEDILELLKEPEPKMMELCNGELYCPSCGEKLKSYYHYCNECGQAVKWDAAD